MKKLALLLLVGVLALPLSAQVSAIKHLSLGVTAGFDGFGAQAAMPINKSLEVRAGFSFWGNKSFTLQDMSVENLSAKFVERMHVDPGATMDISSIFKVVDTKVLLDYFPSTMFGFHVTGGVHIGAVSNFMSFKTEPLPVDDKSRYNTDYMEVAGEKIGTDKEGIINVDLGIPLLKPYLGIGFGRAIPLRDSKKLSFTFDMGLLYVGNLDFTLYNLDLEPVVVNGSELREGLGFSNANVLDAVLSTPILPVMRLAFNYKLF